MPGFPRAIAAVLVMAVGLTAVAGLALRFDRLRTSLRQAVLDDARRTTAAAAARLARDQQVLVELVRRLVVDLESGALTLAVIDRRLAEEVARRPDVFSIAITSPPGPDGPPHVPAVIRTAQGHRLFHVEEFHDPREAEWYLAVTARPGPGWYAPIHVPISGHFLAFYCAPWRPPAGADAPGRVCATWSLSELAALRAALPAGRFGYTWLLSHEGRTLAHPEIDWVRAARTPGDVADAGGDPRLRAIGRRARAGQAGVEQAVDPLTGGDAVLLQAPIAASGWSLVAVVLHDAILAGEPVLRRRQIELAVAALLTLAAATATFCLGGRR